MDVFHALAQEPYESRGIIHSEVALIIHCVRRLGIRQVIETGRARGQSTYLLAKYLPDVDIQSVEMRKDADAQYGFDRVKDMKNVWLYEGDGAEIVPQLVANAYEIPMAILCDGPKGAKAVELVENCFKLYPWVKIAFIHDMRRLDHGGPSPHRATAVERLPRHRFSDDPRYVAATSWMDAEVVKAGGPCGPQHEAVFGSYGPTLGVFSNSKQQQARPNP